LGKPFVLEHIFPIISTSNSSGLREYPSCINPEMFDNLFYQSPIIISSDVAPASVIVIESSDEEEISTSSLAPEISDNEEVPVEQGFYYFLTLQMRTLSR
jgi:hypothetical protein